MANQTVDWFLQRLYGVPSCEDGYGNAVLVVNANAQEHNLGRNSMYLMQARHADGYYAVLDGYENATGTNTNSDSNQNAESSVTDANGVYIGDGDEVILTTHIHRHVLSIKRPDGTDNANMEVRIIKKEPGKGFKDSDNSA